MLTHTDLKTIVSTLQKSPLSLFLSQVNSEASQPSFDIYYLHDTIPFIDLFQLVLDVIAYIDDKNPLNAFKLNVKKEINSLQLIVSKTGMFLRMLKYDADKLYALLSRLILKDPNLKPVLMQMNGSHF
jgi:hypothetical protein